MAFATSVALSTTGRWRLTKRAQFSCLLQPKASMDLDTSVYLVTDRRLAGPRGVLYTVERALEGEGPGRRATIVQYVANLTQFTQAIPC